VQVAAKGRCAGHALYSKLMEATAFWAVTMWVSSKLERYPKTFVVQFQQFFSSILSCIIAEKTRREMTKQFWAGFSEKKKHSIT
jgi:hypothetical protein